jgi:glutathione peroxidase
MNIYQYSAKMINGEDFALNEYSGKVLLIVNVASKCGFTPQYQELQELYTQYRDRGFEVLGFPCGQFMNQELDSSNEIAQFCTLNYGVTFPMFEKIEVNGINTHPLFVYLKKEAKGVMGSKQIKWNFTKFLINREGHVIARFAPSTLPSHLKDDIEQLLI